MAKIKRIYPGRDRARYISKSLREDIKEAASTLGDKLSGYALVAWDGCGEVYATYDAGAGIIGPSLVPDFAKTQLSNAVICTYINGPRK